MTSAATNAFWAKHGDKLIAMKERGKDAAYIAAALGCTESYIYNQLSALRKTGVVGLPVATNARIAFTPEMDAALRAAVEGGSSFKAHAAASGVSETVVQRRAKDLGLRSPVAREIDVADVKPKLAVARAEGKSWRAIAALLSISEASVRRLAGEMNLPKPPVLEVKSKPHAPVIRAARVAKVVAPKPPRAPRPVVVKVAKPPVVVRIVEVKAAPVAALRLPKVVSDVFTAPDDAYLVTIHELRTVGDCRWPYGERAPFMYCGKPATDGVWCCEHGRLAYAGAARPTMKAYAPTKAGRGLAMQREARS